jgi:hypothetical protein
MLTKPRWLLDLEGASIFVLAVFLLSHEPFFLGAVRAFVSSAGSIHAGLSDARCGAAFYSLVHAY